MQESNGLDNSQVIRDLGWLSGILDGEGSLVLGAYKRRHNKTNYYYRVLFYSSSKDVIDKLDRILSELGVGHFVEERKNYGNLGKLVGYAVQISRISEILKLLSLIKDDLTCKKERAELMIQFCRLRTKRKNQTLSEQEQEIFNYWQSSIKTRS